MDIKNCLEAFVVGNPNGHRSIAFQNEVEMRKFYGAVAPFCPEQANQPQLYFSRNSNIADVASSSEDAACVAMNPVKIIPMPFPHSLVRNGSLVFVTIPQHMRLARSQRSAESVQSSSPSLMQSLDMQTSDACQDLTTRKELDDEMLQPSLNDELAYVCGLIKRVMEDHSHVKREPNWMDGVCQYFLVVPEMLTHLKNAFSALGSWINPLSDEQEKTEARNSIDTILNVLAVISNSHESAHDVIKRCMPSNEALTELDSIVLKTLECANSQPENTIKRSEAFKITIDCAIKASSACMDRMSWFEKTVAASRGDYRVIQENLERYAEKVMECQNTIESSVRFVEEKNQDKGTRSEQIRAIVYKQRDELIRKGEPAAFAELQAYDAAHDAIAALLRELENCDVEIKCRQEKLANVESAVRFYRTLVGLLDCVRQKQDQTLKQLIEAQKVAENEATSGVRKYIPILTRSSLEVYQFQPILQKNAHEKQEQKRNELVEHIKVFGDQVPSEEQLLKRQIHEFGEAIENSKKTTQEIAEAQEVLWNEKRILLPSSVWDLLILEHEKLWHQLSGSAREVVRELIETMNDEHLIWQ